MVYIQSINRLKFFMSFLKSWSIHHKRLLNAGPWEENQLCTVSSTLPSILLHLFELISLSSLLSYQVSAPTSIHRANITPSRHHSTVIL